MPRLAYTCKFSLCTCIHLEFVLNLTPIHPKFGYLSHLYVHSFDVLILCMTRDACDVINNLTAQLKHSSVVPVKEEQSEGADNDDEQYPHPQICLVLGIL